MKIMLLIVFAFFSFDVAAQDSIINNKLSQAGKYLSETNTKAKRISNNLNKQTTDMLANLYLAESHMQETLQKVDPAAALKAFNNLPNNENDYVNNALAHLPAPLKGRLDDTQQTTLAFLKNNNSVLGKAGSQLDAVSKNYDAMMAQLQQAEQIKAYIQQRKEELMQQLGNYTACAKQLQIFKSQVYQYSSKVQAYKQMLKDPHKAEAQAIAFLRNLPAYNDFIAKHSQIASLFNLGANFNDSRSLEGLQTRSMIDQVVQLQVGSGAGAMEQINTARDQFQQQFATLKNKFPNLSSAADMPDYEPKDMKIKKILGKFKPGGNIQSQKNNQYFPGILNIEGQVAYQFHKNGSVGVGLAYMLGTGEGWSKIAFSNRGIGYRSFIDWRLKGSFFVNGGYELNHINAFSGIEELRHWNGFQESGLIGISEKYPIGPKLKANVMLLFDFLATRQLPKSDLFKFRVGYTF
jgi:hypothetical protein